jgi:hypothetical protein
MKTILLIITILAIHFCKVMSQDYCIKGTGNGYTVSDPDSFLIKREHYRYTHNKDTFIEISSKRWYNYATAEMRDSTDFYKIIDVLIDSYQEYRKETCDSSYKTLREKNDFLSWLIVKYKM